MSAAATVATVVAVAAAAIKANGIVPAGRPTAAAAATLADKKVTHLGELAAHRG